MKNIFLYKRTAEVYHFNIDSEYFTFFIDSDSKTLSIESSLGSFGYRWNDVGSDFKRFLFERNDFNYIVNKFAISRADSTDELDIPRVAELLRKEILRARKRGDLESYEARDLFDNAVDCCEEDDLRQIAESIPDVSMYDFVSYRIKPMYCDLEKYLAKIAQWFKENEFGEKCEDIR